MGLGRFPIPAAIGGIILMYKIILKQRQGQSQNFPP
jgi:hypothetical protein